MAGHRPHSAAPVGRVTGGARRSIRLTWCGRAAAVLAVVTCTDPAPTTTGRDSPPVPGGAPRRALSSFGEGGVPVSNPGKWAASLDWPHVAIHMHLLPNGKVLTWPGEEHSGRGHKEGQDASVWDPVTGARQSVPNLRTDIFCSGHTLLPDGRVFVAGGHYSEFEGSRDINVFDGKTAKWSRETQMNAGRWYPTAITLGNGDVLVAGGTTESAQQNMVAQVWRPRGGWRSLTTAQGSLPYYPWMFVAPDGRVFYAGPSSAQTGYLDVNGTGRWDLASGSFPVDAAMEGEGAVREYGSAVMLDGVVLRMGGGGWSNKRRVEVTPITNTAEIIDLRDPKNVAAPAWVPMASMKHARRHMTAVALPDGKVLVVGGTPQHGGHIAGSFASAVKIPEIYDPAAKVWTDGAPMATARLYHSTATLLPDGRVLVAGGGAPAPPNVPDNRDAEIYSPPYLFDAAGNALPRPTIGAGAPASIAYRQSFTVGVSYGPGVSPRGVGKVTLVRLGSVTHTFNANQRLVSLAFTESGGSVTITAPDNGNLAPPGHYMLFIVDKAGVPSVSKIVQLL